MSFLACGFAPMTEQRMPGDTREHLVLYTVQTDGRSLSNGWSRMPSPTESVQRNHWSLERYATYLDECVEEGDMGADERDHALKGIEEARRAIGQRTRQPEMLIGGDGEAVLFWSDGTQRAELRIHAAGVFASYYDDSGEGRLEENSGRSAMFAAYWLQQTAPFIREDDL